MLQVAQLRAHLAATLVLGANLIGDREAIVISLARATELTRPADIAGHAAAAALKGLSRTDLIARDALAILDVPFDVANVIARAGAARERRASVTRGARGIVAAVRGAVCIQVVRTGAHADEAIGGIALGTRGAARVELTRGSRTSEIAKVPARTVRVHATSALAEAQAIKV